MADQNELGTPRGALIVFEGLDRAGKTTQSQALVQYLNKHDVPTKLIRFPDRTTPIGKVIDHFLRSDEDTRPEVVHLLFSANRWELADEIRGYLSLGVTVVLDRYAYSGAAYSSAKGLDARWCVSPDIGLPRPDVVVYLDIKLTTQAEREGWGEERYERTEFQRKVRDEYARYREEEWAVVDANVSEREVTAVVTAHAISTIKRVRAERPTVRSLWQEYKTQ